MDRRDRVFIVAEAGVNHNGSAELAAKLVDAAAQCGADAVKFQTFTTEKLVATGAKTAGYQERQTGETEQFALLKRLELPIQVFPELLERSIRHRIEFMSTPFDTEAADWLIGCGMKRLKVASGEITNHPFLEHLAAKHLPLIVSTGMSSLDEVGEAVEHICAVWNKTGLERAPAAMLTILHCTSNYPTAPEDVNLLAMQTLARTFRVPVGYSDHTNGTLVALAAVALGASVIEKHLTLDRGLPGPDHQASLEPEAFRRMVSDVRQLEQCLGSADKKPSEQELPVRRLVRRSVTAVRPLRAGQVVTPEDVGLLRPGTGIPPKDLRAVCGMRARTDILAGTTLSWSDLSS